MEFYAVSVRQPHASLILAGVKRHEARSWHFDTPGWLLLHASSNYGLTQTEVYADPSIRRAIKKANMEDRAAWTRGAIIGAFEVIGFAATPPASMSKIDKLLCGDDAECYWKIGDTITLPSPIPCKGALGLFLPSAQVMSLIRTHITTTSPR